MQEDTLGATEGATVAVGTAVGTAVLRQVLHVRGQTMRAGSKRCVLKSRPQCRSLSKEPKEPGII